MFGQDLFTPPEKVDGVRILCRCRDIKDFMRSPDGKRDLGSMATLIVGSNRPACWEDEQTIMNPTGGDTFNVTIGHPAFYQYALDSGGIIGAVTGFRGIGGKRKTRRLKKRQLNKRHRFSKRARA